MSELEKARMQLEFIRENYGTGVMLGISKKKAPSWGCFVVEFKRRN